MFCYLNAWNTLRRPWNVLFRFVSLPCEEATNNGERRELRENARANAALHIRVSVRVPLPLDPLIESLLVGLRLLHFTTFVRTIPNKGLSRMRLSLMLAISLWGGGCALGSICYTCSWATC